MEAVLLLEDGQVFYGQAFGAHGKAVGEVVFHTGMTGYQEIITDPSYKGQMVTMTYPHIGNYGVNNEDVESSGPVVEALIVREYCPSPSNFRSEMSLDAYLKAHHVMGIHQIDTRALTRHIREQGAMMGILSTENRSIRELSDELSAYPKMQGHDMVRHVTRQKEEKWDEKAAASWYHGNVISGVKKMKHVVAYDYGIKRNILRLLTAFGLDVTVVPAFTPVERIKEMAPDGLFLSNGPGDPEGVDYAVKSVRALASSIPVFGICLGHQLLGLAFGAHTYKMKFGHHCSNHPVKNLITEDIEITSQNHNYAVDPETLTKAGFELTHRNLNDCTVEGMRHRELPVFSVQYHPEASPGPHDSLYLFRYFYELMK